MPLLKKPGIEFSNITDNAIIPLKRRVVTRYDPVAMIWRLITGK